MARLLLLFILVPVVELILLIELGGIIGTLATIALIVITGALGAALARWQGLGILRQMQSEIAHGRVPAAPLLDGAFILVAAALLVTPGFLTDTVGFLCLVPQARSLLKRWAWKRLERAIREGKTNVIVHVGRGPQ